MKQLVEDIVENLTEVDYYCDEIKGNLLGIGAHLEDANDLLADLTARIEELEAEEEA